MVEEKRERAGEASESSQKSPRLDSLAAAGSGCSDAPASPTESSEWPSSGEAEAGTSSDSTGDSGRCEHISLDRDLLFRAVFDLTEQRAVKRRCILSKCKTTCNGNEGMMKCIDCSKSFCSGWSVETGSPQGHALWHAGENQHWVAQRCDEPNLGYCFLCARLMRLTDWTKDDYAVAARNEKDQQGLGDSVAKDGWGMGSGIAKGDWEPKASGSIDESGMESSLANELGDLVATAKKDDWQRVPSIAMDDDASGYVNGDGYFIRGILNLGETCYMNATLQCLLALGKLRTMIQSLDSHLGSIGLHLQQLFQETHIVKDARHTLNPSMILQAMHERHPNQFLVWKMEDSHEFLMSLFNAVDAEVEQQNKVHVLKGEKDPPARSVASPPRNKSHGSQTDKSDGDNAIQRVAQGSAYQIPGSGLGDGAMEKTPRPFQVDSSEVKDVVHSHMQTQKNDVPQEIIEAPMEILDFIPDLFDDTERMEEATKDKGMTYSVKVTTKDKGEAQSSDIVNDEAKHMNSLGSIEDCLELFAHRLKERCENCSKVAEQIMVSTNINTTVDGDQTELSDRKTCPSERSSDCNSLSIESPSRKPFHSDVHHQVILSCGENDSASCSAANEKAEIDQGVQEARLPTDKQTDLLSAQDSPDTSTQNQACAKQAMLDDHTAQQTEVNQNEQKDGNGCAIQTQLINKLPAILIIPFKRYSNDLSKLRGHVSFKEILHLGPFMDPSSEEKDNSSYLLVGVIEHRGHNLHTGHYVAYVRGAGLKHQSSGSLWICADDHNIKEISIEQVLRCEAYILFYERIEEHETRDKDVDDTVEDKDEGNRPFLTEGPSELCDDLLLNIFSRLEHRTAIRVSSLSRRWNREWDLRLQSNSYYVGENSFLPCENSFLPCEMLQTLEGQEANGNRFDILCLVIESKHMSEKLFRRCLECIARSGVKDLYLERRSPCLALRFSFPRASKQLVRLSLRGVTLANSTRCFKGCKNFCELVAIKLWGVTVSDWTLRKILAKCPALRVLELGYCNHLERISDSVSGLKLHNVTVVECSGVNSIDLRLVPDLLSVSFSGRYLNSLYFPPDAQISKLYFCYTRTGDQLCSQGLLSNMFSKCTLNSSALTTLTICSNSLKVVNCLSEPCKMAMDWSFQNVQELQIVMFEQSRDNLASFSYLLQNGKFDVLQRLFVELPAKRGVTPSKLGGHVLVSECLLHKLKLIKLTNFSWNEAEISLLLLLLKISSSLDKMVAVFSAGSTEEQDQHSLPCLHDSDIELIISFLDSGKLILKNHLDYDYTKPGGSGIIFPVAAHGEIYQQP